LSSGVYIFAEEPTPAAEDVSHHSEEDPVKQSAMHQPEEPCSRPLSFFETEER
jgi:hypothetical protein